MILNTKTTIQDSPNRKQQYLYTDNLGSKKETAVSAIIGFSLQREEQKM
jgi:hypothetical protein